MASTLVQTFIDSLQEFERTGRSERLIHLFADHCRVSNSTSPHIFEGRDQVAGFWRSYRSMFDRIETEFTNVLESGALVALEWTSRGRLAHGGSFTYDGVTLLELGDDDIRRLHSYFNPAALRLHHVAADTGDVQTRAEMPEGEATDLTYASPGRMP